MSKCQLPRDRITAAARALFARKGFHSTSVAELAGAANVSVGLIYRLFAGKEDIIAAIVEEDADDRAAEIEALSGALAAERLTVAQAFERLAAQAIAKEYEALSLEILAEAYRTEAVACTIQALCGRYRAALRSLAAHAQPGYDAGELDACEELLLACLFGLGHRKLSKPKLSPGEEAAVTARMILGAIGALRQVAGEGGPALS